MGGKGRRGRGEGSIYKRASDDRWVGSVVLPDGGRKYVYGKTRTEVVREVARLQRDLDAGLAVGSDRQTVAQYVSSWLVSIQPPQVRPNTWRIYRSNMRIHIVPALGRLKLTQLTPQHIQRFYGELGTHLAPVSVRSVHGTLNHALEDAVRLGLITRNVCALVNRPKVPHKQMQVLSRDEARQLLDGVRGERQEALIVLALATGMRVGELLALRWREVDLEACRIRVVATLTLDVNGRVQIGPPKSARGRRQIAVASAVGESLRYHRARQLSERLAAGEAWQELDMVFSDEIGGPLPDGQVRRRHVRIVRTAGLPNIRFHDLRHTCATLLLAQRVDPKVVSEMLGHSTVSITLDIYSHALPDMQQDAASVMGAVLYS